MRLAVAVLMACSLGAQNVTFERILNAHKEPQNWLTYSGDYTGHRHSLLTQINAGNVKRLKVAWTHHTASLDLDETTPLVVDGQMFLTEPPNVVKALDARTGTMLWRYERKIPTDLRLC